MEMEKVFLKRSKRILDGHLWVFSNELAESPKRFEPGSLVEVHDRTSFLGIGYINPRSLIAVRLLTRRNETIDESFIRDRIGDALRYRQSFLDDQRSFRVLFSEGDYLPGLIVDKFDDVLVAQFLTLGIERLGETVAGVLDDMFRPRSMVLRNTSRSRTLEGLPLETKVLAGNPEPLPRVTEGPLTMEVDPLSGQKTGFFLDQRENRIALGRYLSGGKGLDLFCYSGAWALHLAQRGVMMTGVDESESALSQAQRNTRLNGLDSHIAFRKGDVFHYLGEALARGDDYDVVVLDPPAFAKSAATLREALRGYLDINTRALKIVRPGGLLATSSCSHHVDRAVFLDMLHRASRLAGRRVRLLEYRYQSRDHPILLSVPETAYLKCAFLEVQ
jgi:23S rRNA (cytosine1962-C5)-methyltransferase